MGRLIQALVGVIIYLVHPREATNSGCVQLCRIGVEVRNPDLSDMTQREGQYYQAMFNRETECRA